jgi:hypothetical protein
MGCDIHMWVERLETDGAWHVVLDAKVYEDRWYVLFGWLADVRGDGPPIAPARGWPADLDHVLARHIQADDYPSKDLRLEPPGEHTPSWLLVSEILTAFEALPKGEWVVGVNPRTKEPERFLEPMLSQNGLWSFRTDWCSYWANLAQGDGSKVRIVFNFDS